MSTEHDAPDNTPNTDTIERAAAVKLLDDMAAFIKDSMVIEPQTLHDEVFNDGAHEMMARYAATAASVRREAEAGEIPGGSSEQRHIADETVYNAAKVIEAALFVNPGMGGGVEPAWEMYRPEGVALVICQALRNAGLLAAPTTTAELAHLRALKARLDSIEPCPLDHATDWWRGYAHGWNAAQTWLREPSDG